MPGKSSTLKKDESDLGPPSRPSFDSTKEPILLKKRASRSESMNAALLALSAPLESVDQFSAAAPGVDPLLVACQAIAGTMGFSVKTPAGNQAILVERLDAIARASLMRTRRVTLRDAWWRQESGPLLGFRDGQPVALLPSNGRYTLFDPISGHSTTVDSKLAATLDELAFSFYHPLPQGRLTTLRLLHLGFRDCRADLVRVIMTAAVSGLLGLAVPILSGILFDSVIPSAQRTQIPLISAGVIVTGICSALLTLTSRFSMIRIETRAGATMLATVWDRLLRLPVSFFRDYSSGDLAMRAMGIDQVRQIISANLIVSSLSSIFAIFHIGLLFYYSPSLAIPALTAISATLTIIIAGALGQTRYQRKLAAIQGRVLGNALQLVGGVAKIRAAGAEARAFGVWSRDFARQTETSVRARRLSNGMDVFQALLMPFAYCVLMAWAGQKVVGAGAHDLSTGAFLAFSASFQQLMAASLQFGSSLMVLARVVPLIERAKPILQTMAEQDVRKSDPGELSGAIEVNDLSFRYRGDVSPVLRNISFRIEPGEFVAFVGASGSGKSTLLRLLLGCEEVESGSISYDGRELSDLDLPLLRRQVGAVLQNGRLMAGSLAANILGTNHVGLDAAWEAVCLAGLEEEVNAMPMGIHTVIGEGGTGLSGGQRQRVLIARALVNKPKIVFFDEATSALDNHAQAYVSDSLERLNATRIVVAHRLSTIRHAHRIYVLDKGELVETGTYQELMASRGRFYSLAHHQLLTLVSSQQ